MLPGLQSLFNPVYCTVFAHYLFVHRCYFYTKQIVKIREYFYGSIRE